jgi:hypothetical protein
MKSYAPMSIQNCMLLLSLPLTIIFAPLTVSIHSNGKKRLILDLRVVNKHLWKQPVKYEDMRTATQHIKHNSSLF